MTTITAAEAQLTTSLPVAVQSRKLCPVKWWAGFGVLMVAVQAWAFGHWIVTGLATPTPTGPDEAPRWMTITIWTFQAVCLVVGIAGIYWFVIRPWRRDGRLNFDSFMVIGFYLTFWQDPLLNYFQRWATYNSNLYNFGSWTSSIPGWASPDGHLMPEPLFFVVPTYGIVCFLMVMLLSQVMKKAKQKWPRLGVAGTIGVAFAFFVVFGGIVEQLWMRMGIYAYPGAIRALTLFSGHYYQYPVYEAVIFAATFTAWASVRYFRNDKGESVVERGLHELQTSERSKSWLRGLALVGALNAAMLFVYNAPLQFFAMHADEWPADIVNRSYLTDGFCGPGTTYACSGSDTPVPRRGGDHKDPNGELVPAGEDDEDKDDEGAEE